MAQESCAIILPQFIAVCVIALRQCHVFTAVLLWAYFTSLLQVFNTWFANLPVADIFNGGEITATAD